MENQKFQKVPPFFLKIGPEIANLLLLKVKKKKTPPKISHNFTLPRPSSSSGNEKSRILRTTFKEKAGSQSLRLQRVGKRLRRRGPSNRVKLREKVCSHRKAKRATASHEVRIRPRKWPAYHTQEPEKNPVFGIGVGMTPKPGTDTGYRIFFRYIPEPRRENRIFFRCLKFSKKYF